MGIKVLKLFFKSERKEHSAKFSLCVSHSGMVSGHKDEIMPFSEKVNGTK